MNDMNPNYTPPTVREWLASLEGAEIYVNDTPLRRYQHGAVTVRAASFSDADDIRYFFESTELIQSSRGVEERKDPSTGDTFIVSGCQKSFRQISARPVQSQ